MVAPVRQHAEGWKQQLKLLVVTQYFYPENFRVNELVAEMVRRGHDVTVLTGLPNYPQGCLFPGYGWLGPWRELIAGAQVFRVPLFLRARGNGWRLILNYLSFAFCASLAALIRIPRVQDAIFVFEPSPITVGLPAIAASWRCNAPIVFWVLDLWPESLEATGAVRSPWILGKVERLVKWMYSCCHLVLGQSKGFLDNIARLGVPPARLRYFPNWIEIGYEAAALAAKRLGRNEFRIVYAGNIGAAQDFPAVIEAAVKLAQTAPQIRWIVAGDGRMAGWVKREVAARGLHEKFELLGQLPPQNMPSLFASADALLVTLRADPVFALTIPGKVQSYLASGKPVLAMLDGEGARVVEESGAGLVAPAGDADRLAELALRLTAMSAQELEQMGSQARDYAAREFGRELLFERLDSWLQEAAENHQSNRKHEHAR